MSGSQDHQSIITEGKTGKIIQRLTGHSKKVTSIALSPQNTTLGAVVYTSSADRTVKVSLG